MLDRLLVLAVYAADGAVYSGLALVAMLVFAKLRRLALISGALGWGPTLFSARIFGVPIRVKLVPLSSFVVPYPTLFVSDSSKEDVERVKTKVEAKELRGYDELRLLERIGFVTTTPAAAVAIAVAALGPQAAVRLALGDLRTLALGVAGPLSTAPAALDAALVRLHGGGIWSVAARFTAVLLASQVFTLTNLHFVSRDRTTSIAKATSVVMLVTFGVMLPWLFAGVVWLFR